MRILYLIDQLCGIGGAESALLRLARSLPRNRYQCLIGTFRIQPGVGWEEEAGCPVHVFPLSRTYSVDAVRQACRIGRLIRRERVAIVHSFFETSDLFGGVVAKISGCPAVISSRRDLGIQRTRLHWPAYRLLRPVFDRVHTVSDEVAKFMVRRDGLDPARVVTIHSGVDLATIDDAARRAGKAAARSGPAQPVVVTVANVRRVKGLDVLLTAAALVVRRHPHARFQIAGDILDVPYFDELKRLAIQLGIDRHVTFSGKCSDVFGTLRDATVFCLPSRSEGFSNALLEAMACALPCVVTDVGGNREAVLEGITGYLTPSEDPEALAARIDGLLSNPALAATIGAAARKRIEDTFTIERMVQRFAALYGSVLAVRR